MSDGSGLGDLSKELEQAQQASSEDEESETESEMTTDSSTAMSDTTGEAEPTEEQDGADERDPREDPAFPYDDTVQFPIYAREEEARDEFESSRKYEAGRLLEQDHGVKNVEKREMHDAALRLVADHPELWARYVMDARGLDVPDDLGE